MGDHGDYAEPSERRPDDAMAQRGKGIVVMACVNAQFPPMVIRDVMRRSKVVPWDWILDVEMGDKEALRFYDARVSERMSNPGQREADTWSGPEENPKTQYSRLGGVYRFAMSALGSRTCADVVAGTALPDVRR